MVSSDHLGALALQAMLFEVSATPKPGLVDRNNCGAHKDMDFFTFMSSAAALRSSFDEFANAGFMYSGELGHLLEVLRPIGIAAEQRMFKLTKGVNTHKGMIFSLGVLVAVAGYLKGYGEQLTKDKLCDAVAVVCHDITKRDYAKLKDKAELTKGEAMYLKYGVTGVRGELEKGFPSVRTISLPIYEKLCEKGYSVNDALVGALLALLAEAGDTNVLGRHDMETLEYVKRSAKNVLKVGGVETELGRKMLLQLDNDFIVRYISPGGSADLIAITYFIYEVTKTS